jgi:hypothetical protein
MEMLSDLFVLHSAFFGFIFFNRGIAKALAVTKSNG